MSLQSIIAAFLEWLAPAIAWAQSSAAEHHAATTFTVLGFVFDKVCFVAGVAMSAPFVVLLYFALVLYTGRDDDITEW